MWESMVEKVLYERNENWMKVIDAFPENHDPYLIAPGGRHLYGTKGVIQELRDRGFTVDHYDGFTWPVPAEK